MFFDLNLTGAMTFCESDVGLNKVFSNNKSEDSLNIIRSKFQLNNSKFSNTFSDAIDIILVTVIYPMPVLIKLVMMELMSGSNGYRHCENVISWR